MKEVSKTFWTRGRAGATCFVFVLAALVISSCKSDDTANLSANRAAQPQAAGTPKITITSQRGAQPQQPQQPQQAPQLEVLSQEIMNREIQGVGGKPFRLADFNDRVVVLDIWATWCGPCKLQIPHLIKLNNEYKSKGVEVVGLTTEDPASDAELVRDFAEEFKINYKLGWATADIALPLMKGSASIPQTLVIAPGGRVLNRFRGFSPRLDEMIRAAVDKATEVKGD